MQTEEQLRTFHELFICFRFYHQTKETVLKHDYEGLASFLTKSSEVYIGDSLVTGKLFQVRAFSCSIDLLKHYIQLHPTRAMAYADGRHGEMDFKQTLHC